MLNNVDEGGILSEAGGGGQPGSQQNRLTEPCCKSYK